MSKYSVSTIFKGVDKVSKPLGKIRQGISNFARGAENGLRKVDGYMNKAAGGILAAGGAVVAGLGLVTAALDKQAESADNLAKTARRLKFPIEELQEWRFIGEQSGISVDMMDKSIGTFAKRLGEAKKGTGALYSGLAKLNPKLLEQVQGAKDVSEAFDIYIKGLRNIKDPSDQAAVASAAFSKQGMKLIQITHNSSDAIEEMREQMQANGLITQKQAENAEAYNDAMNRLDKTFKGFMQSVLMPLFPLATKVADRIREFALANKDVIASKIVSYGEKIVEFFKFMYEHGSKIAKVVGIILGVSVAVKGLIAVMTLLNLVMAANPIVLGALAIAAAVTGIYLAWEPIKEFFSGIFASISESFNAWMDSLTSKFDSIKTSIMFAFEPLKAFFSDLFGGIKDSFSNTVGGVMDKVKGIGDFFGFGGGSEPVTTNSTVTPQERIATEIKESKESMELYIRPEKGMSAYTYGAGNSSRLNLINTAD